MRTRTMLGSLAALALGACADQPTAPLAADPGGVLRTAASIASTPASARTGAVDGAAGGGGVYTMTNGAAGNAVLAFRRAPDGVLSALGAVSTGGTGTGGNVDPLASQYALQLDDAHRFLFVVNAGSNEVSSFAVAADGSIRLVDRVASGGVRPVSLASHGAILYALNAGDNSVSGFRVTPQGALHPIQGSTRALAPGAAGASTIRFAPDGASLVVTETAANRLERFSVGADGRTATSSVTVSSGAGPFGFDITPRNQAIVTEVRGANPDAAISSYAFDGSSGLRVATASLNARQRATCWLILTGDGRLAFVANSGSGSIGAVRVANDGTLTLLDERAGISGPAAGQPFAAIPLDLDLAGGDRFLYVLEAGTASIGAFDVGGAGTLGARADTPLGVPAPGLQGLAAW